MLSQKKRREEREKREMTSRGKEVKRKMIGLRERKDWKTDAQRNFRERERQKNIRLFSSPAVSYRTYRCNIQVNRA